MSREKEAPDESDDLMNPDRFIQHTFCILPLFKIIRGIDEFKEFVGRGAVENRSVFRGYRLLVRKLLDSYLDDLERDSLLGCPSSCA